jgi:hypothetical protein
MADNYLEFSTDLELRSADERRWLEAQLEDVEHRDNTVPRFLLDHPEPEAGSIAGFEVAWKDDSVVFYSEESANVDHLVHLVQKFLRKFRPQEAWSVTWAETCSKPRIDEFGGGAAFVTAGDVRWMGAHQFVEDQLAVFQAHTDAPKIGDAD